MDFLQRFLAQILDSLKAKSPVLFFVIGIILTALKYAIDNAAVANWTIPAQVTEWVLWLAALVLGSRTTSYLSTSNNAK